MIKTLKFSNGSLAKVGNLQIQPVVSDLAHSVVKQAKSPLSIKAPAVLPPHQTPISTPVISHANDDLKVEKKASLQTIATSLISDKKFMLPPFHGSTNNILPSFALHLEPNVLLRPHTDELVVTSKKFEPYEQLTGISHERPEVVMLTNFLPLFKNDVNHSQPSFINLVENGGIYPFMTDAGRFVDTHLQARHLRHVDVIHLLKGLRLNYIAVADQYSKRRQAFEKNIDSLRDSANFLLELVRSLERLKSQLDLRDDIHSVDPLAIIKLHHLNFTKIHALSTSTVLHDSAKRYMPPSYTLADTLVGLGYKSDNIKHKFSSTKIWLQLLLEMKDLLVHHSAEFIDIEPVAQRRDENAIGITRLSTPHFTFRRSLPNLPSLNDLSALVPQQANGAINTLNQAWQSLYQDVHFRTNEAQIAALINMSSKEFRYSYGLSSPDVQQALLANFDYAVTPADNVDVFDAVIGKFGNNITDFPAEQTNSLANIAQRQPAENVAILTFETKYVDGDTGTLTPGGNYYVDQVLRTDGKAFDTSRLDEISGLFEGAYHGFNTVVNGMNVLATRIYDPYDKTHTQFSSVLSSPVDLVGEVLKNLVDERTGNTLPQALNDNLGAVYAAAAKNNRIKSALFLLTMARITRTYNPGIPFFHINNQNQNQDNTPLTDALIKEIIDVLVQTVPQTLTGNQFINDDFFQTNKKLPTLTEDTIKASLKSGTVLTKFIESMMQQIVTSFREDDRATVNGHTRFNGYLDTTITMVVFDSILQMVARYNNQTIVSSNYGHTKFAQGTLTFNISKTTVNHRSSISDLITRLEKEVALTQKLVYTTLNSLHKLLGAFQNYSNYLKSPPALDKLRQVSSIVGDPDILHLLMSEQQIMMLASTVHDLVDRVAQSNALPDNGDVDGDGDFDADDELKILDDSVTLPKLRNAVYGLFGTREYASTKGYNKKIITVGVPLGFTRRLKQRISIRNLKRSTFIDKQSDIVNVVVYKVDLQNSDIVYKPQRFMFELSRFPVRNDKHFLTIPEKPTIDDIVHAIPTRDFGSGLPQGNEVTYWSFNTDDVNNGRRATFADESYSFLSQAEKSQIIRNHVVSYLLEVYTRLLTGMSVADHHFDIVEPPRPVDDELVKLVTEHHVHHVANLFNVGKVTPDDLSPTGGVLFSSTISRQVGYTAHDASAAQSDIQPQRSNAAGIAGSISHATQFSALQPTPETKTEEAQRNIGTLSTNLSGISHRNVTMVLHGLRTISNMAHMITPLADPLAVSKRIISPKQFDRVFNVIIDPDDFEIDYDKTVKTPHGKQALEQMILKGDIIPETENFFARNIIGNSAQANLNKNPIGRPFIQGREASNSYLYRFRDRDKNQGDLSFEKYFVTVETYGEEVI